MRKSLIISGIGLTVCANFNAQAQTKIIQPKAIEILNTTRASNQPPTTNWTGTGEVGLSSARGNSRSDNLNVKLGLKQETETWINNASFESLLAKGDVTTTNANGETVTRLSSTANRYGLGGSMGYKFNPNNYLVTVLRYDHDLFGTNLWQGTVSFGYGHIFIKNATIELALELGPGFARYRPANAIQTVNGSTVTTTSPIRSQGITRGQALFTYNITANTSLQNTFLLEAGGLNTFVQNDLGFVFNINKKLALKVGYQVRYNSAIASGAKHTDTLTTTNLAYSF
jgi:putative salt-induced outer membrane protein